MLFKGEKMIRLLEGTLILAVMLLLTMKAGNLWAGDNGNDPNALQSSRLISQPVIWH
jgi:hypothetical protein